jgi:hypothetical protein
MRQDNIGSILYTYEWCENGEHLKIKGIYRNDTSSNIMDKSVY